MYPANNAPPPEEKRHKMRIGYKRVSSLDQNTARQLEGIQVDKVFEDHASGKDTARPQLQAALEWTREGDRLVVHSMDRLCRNLGDLRRVVESLTSRGVEVEFIKEGMIFNGDDTPMAKFMLNIMGSFAELERSMILERQREGVALAKKAGKYLGRAPAIRAGNGKLAELTKLAAENTPVSEMARQVGVSRQTIYSWLKARKQPQEVAA
jgi:DNA invertase Pin-like site-specific DNA recombinase